MSAIERKIAERSYSGVLGVAEVLRVLVEDTGSVHL